MTPHSAPSASPRRLSPFLKYAFGTTLCWFALSTPASAQPSADKTVRVVDCDAPVQSRKRGIAANRLSEKDFRALSTGVSWYYNWSTEPGGTGKPPKDVPMDFVPMAWGPGASTQKALERYLASGARPRAVLAINEPNLVERQVAAPMTPEEAMRLYADIKKITDRHRVPLIGPHMSIGSPPHMSVKAHDPILNAETTYTYMVPYLDAFLHYAKGAGVEIDGLGMHPYMVAAGLEGLMNLVAERYGKPIWVTEFSNSEEPLYDIPYKLRDLVQAVDYLERSPHIHAYSYFKERNAVHAPLGLFTENDGELNELGKAYVRMPVHDPEIYYRLPGRLEAEKYVAISDATIWPTTDADGFLHLRTEKPGARLDYHVHVETAGEHRLRLRVTGAAGRVTVSFDGVVAARLDAPAAKSGWQTLEAAVSLKPGAQVLRCEFEAEPVGLNWIEVEKRGD